MIHKYKFAASLRNAGAAIFFERKKTMSTVIIGALVGTALFFAVRSLRKDKKAGRSVCGGNCASCGCCNKGKAK